MLCKYICIFTIPKVLLSHARVVSVLKHFWMPTVPLQLISPFACLTGVPYSCSCFFLRAKLTLINLRCINNQLYIRGFSTMFIFLLLFHVFLTNNSIREGFQLYLFFFYDSIIKTENNHTQQ